MRTALILLAIAIWLPACGTASEPTAVFTGEECTYEGPTEFELGSTVTFAFVNESGVTDMGFSVWPVPEDTNPDRILAEGLFGVVPDDGTYEMYDAVFPPVEIGSTSSLDITLDRSGRHAIICFDASGIIPGDRDYAILFDVG